MRLLTLRGWIYVILVGSLAAAVTFLACVQIRHWMTDEAQLHEIVRAIQTGQIPMRAPAPPEAPKQPPQ